MKIDVDLRQINAAIADLKLWEIEKVEGVRNAVNTAAINTRNSAVRRLTINDNVIYGRLRSSIEIEPVGNFGMELQVGTRLEYGPYVEFGTGIHAKDGTGRKTPWIIPKKIIPPKGQRKYTWPEIEVDGEAFYVTRGSRPHPFLFPAWEEVRPSFEAELKAVLGT